MTTTPSPTPGAMPIHAKAPTHPGTPEALPLAACHRREHTTTRRRHRDACCNDGEQHPQNNVKRPRPSLRCRRRQSRVRPCRPSILPHISTTSSRTQDHALNDIDAIILSTRFVSSRGRRRSTIAEPSVGNTPEATSQYPRADFPL